MKKSKEINWHKMKKSKEIIKFLIKNLYGNAMGIADTNPS